MNTLDKLLSLLEVYFSIQFFSNNEMITFHSLGTFPMSNIGGKLIVSKRILLCLGHNPLGKKKLMPSRSNTTLLETMMTSI